MNADLFLALLASLAIYWVLVAILVRLLRARHPNVYFSELGAPRLTQLATNYRVSIARWRLQWRFLRFLWGFQFLRLRDSVVSAIGVASITVSISTFVFLGLLVSGVAK